MRWERLFKLTLLKNLIRLLENKKYKVIPIKLKHMYTQGGGIHCATLYTVRESKLEDHFN